MNESVGSPLLKNSPIAWERDPKFMDVDSYTILLGQERDSHIFHDIPNGLWSFHIVPRKKIP
jgi:hypothetical protein